MTRDDIIRMAREAGIVTGENLKFSEGYRYRSVGAPKNVREDCLIRFAKAVAGAASQTNASVYVDELLKLPSNKTLDLTMAQHHLQFLTGNDLKQTKDFGRSMFRAGVLVAIARVEGGAQ